MTIDNLSNLTPHAGSARASCLGGTRNEVGGGEPAWETFNVAMVAVP